MGEDNLGEHILKRIRRIGSPLQKDVFFKILLRNFLTTWLTEHRLDFCEIKEKIWFFQVRFLVKINLKNRGRYELRA